MSIYSNIKTLAASMDEESRNMFAALITELAMTWDPPDRLIQQGAVYRWLREHDYLQPQPQFKVGPEWMTEAQRRLGLVE